MKKLFFNEHFVDMFSIGLFLLIFVCFCMFYPPKYFVLREPPQVLYRLEASMHGSTGFFHKIQKRLNTEPQGVPDALDGTVR